MKTITDSSFHEEVTTHKGHVIVKFGADWCRPCREMDKIILTIDADIGTKVKIVSANVDYCQVNAQKFGIQRVPALVAFKDGKINAIKSGSATRTQILDWINSVFPGVTAL